MLQVSLASIDMADHQQFYVSLSRFLFMFVKQKLGASHVYSRDITPRADNRGPSLGMISMPEHICVPLQGWVKNYKVILKLKPTRSLFWGSSMWHHISLNQRASVRMRAPRTFRNLLLLFLSFCFSLPVQWTSFQLSVEQPPQTSTISLSF